MKVGDAGGGDAANLVLEGEQENTGIESKPLKCLGTVAKFILDGFPFFEVIVDDLTVSEGDGLSEDLWAIGLGNIGIDCGLLGDGVFETEAA